MKASKKSTTKVRALKPKDVQPSRAAATKGGTSVSNVLKVRHDGAKNTIGN